MATTPAFADWEYTHWGMTPEQVAAASGGNVKVVPKAERKDTGGNSEMAAVGTFTMGGRTLSGGFQFNTVTNGLECVIYGANGNQVPIVTDLLTKKYGQAEKKDFGGVAYSLIWKGPDPIEFAVNNDPLSGVVNHCAPGAG
jgi:hypothetical protein